MTLIASETIAKNAGNLYLAPYPEPPPLFADLGVEATLAANGWVNVGWLHEDGPSIEGFGGDNSKHYGWNATAPIRSITRITDPTVPVTLLQWNTENLGLYFADAVYTAATKTLAIPEAGVPDNYSLLIVVVDGVQRFGIYVAKVTPRGGDSFEFPGDGLAPIPVVFDVLSTGTPTDYVKIIGVEPEGTP